METSLLRLSEQQVALEGVASTAETVSALRTGAAAGKAAVGELGAERVDAVLEELSEAAEEARQVQDALGLPLGAAADLDDDELAAELEVGWLQREAGGATARGGKPSGRPFATSPSCAVC